MKELITAVGNFVRFILTAIVILFIIGLYRVFTCPTAFMY